MNFIFLLLYYPKTTLKSPQSRENAYILPYIRARYYDRQYKTLQKSVNQHSCLSISTHGVISLPDATSYDNGFYYDHLYTKYVFVFTGTKILIHEWMAMVNCKIVQVDKNNI